MDLAILVPPAPAQVSTQAAQTDAVQQTGAFAAVQPAAESQASSGNTSADSGNSNGQQGQQDAVQLVSARVAATARGQAALDDARAAALAGSAKAGVSGGSAPAVPYAPLEAAANTNAAASGYAAAAAAAPAEAPAEPELSAAA